jgi:hypothetical protein
MCILDGFRVYFEKNNYLGYRVIEAKRYRRGTSPLQVSY